MYIDFNSKKYFLTKFSKQNKKLKLNINVFAQKLYTIIKL